MDTGKRRRRKLHLQNRQIHTGEEGGERWKIFGDGGNRGQKWAKLKKKDKLFQLWRLGGEVGFGGQSDAELLCRLTQ